MGDDENCVFCKKRKDYIAYVFKYSGIQDLYFEWEFGRRHSAEPAYQREGNEDFDLLLCS